MKTKTITYLLLAALASAITSMTHAQTQSQAKENDSKPLIIYSSHGSIEIKDTTACRQSKDAEGKISIQCANQCTQKTDPKDGKILISC